MNSQCQPAPASATELAGDLAPLVEQLGSPEGIASVAAVTAALRCPRITDVRSLGSFLRAYSVQLLQPVELPAIFRAWQHASRFEARELIALDQSFGCEPLLKPFAFASLHAGRSQLRRLRPLRDQKLVQRYLHALDTGEVSGWHTLVYGVTLATYSLAPRQGLAAYAQQTLSAFAHSAGRGLKTSESELNSLIDFAISDVPQAINTLVDAGPFFFVAATPAVRAALPV